MTAIDQSEFPEFGAPWVFGSYYYAWTGLKPFPDQAALVGQWLAWPSTLIQHNPSIPALYVTVPGFITGIYQLGNVFNLMTKDNRWITHQTNPEQALTWIREGHMLLLDLMLLHSNEW